MYQFIEPFGHHVSGNTIGETWLSLVKAVIDYGDTTYDEKRKRFSIQNVLYQIESYSLLDDLLDQYANKKNIDALIYLTFKGEKMYDFDVVPSFSPGAKSYYTRLKEGRMMEYVVKRLGSIPESKKGVMSFIQWSDYNAILDTPHDDYLPCHTTIQFRLIEKAKRYQLNVISHFRSIDAFQKSCGDFVVTAMLAHEVARRLKAELGKPIVFGPMTGLITDAHIYGECMDDARQIINKWQK